MWKRPETSEFDPFYEVYIGRVPEGDIVSTLAGGVESTLTLLRSCPEDLERYRYAPGKWSIREVAGHVSDAERMYAYRALHFARADPSPLPGMDPAGWAASSNAAERPLSALADELAAVRAATVSLFTSLEAATWEASGVAGGRRFTVRSLAWVIAGHEIHHRESLATRYLAGDELASSKRLPSPLGAFRQRRER